MATPKEKTPVMAANRIVHVNDPTSLPIDYSSTPGGTLYSTTPGGTRIVYDRSFLMHLKNSPISQTPPKNFASIPNNICKDLPNHNNKISPKRASPPNNKASPEMEETEQFQMDM